MFFWWPLPPIAADAIGRFLACNLPLVAFWGAAELAHFRQLQQTLSALGLPPKLQQTLSFSSRKATQQSMQLAFGCFLGRC